MSKDDLDWVLRSRARKLNSRATRLGRPVVERVSAKDLEAIVAIFNGECFYCMTPLTFRGLLANGSFDHVVPLVFGGRNSKRNLVPSCQKCNNSKGEKLLTYYAKRIRFVVSKEEK